MKIILKNVIEKTLRGLVEGLTGIATSSKKDLILSISHTFQRMRGGQFLSELHEEWNRFRIKGKVKDDYQFSEQHQSCLQELLEFLEKDSPDAERFSVLKKIFLVAATEQVTDRGDLLPLQFMKIARNLTTGEVILLTTIFNFARDKTWDENAQYGAGQWVKDVTDASGLKHRALVEIHEQGLMDKKLLTPRQYSDRSGVHLHPHFRLTDLGYDLCKFIEEYE